MDKIKYGFVDNNYKRYNEILYGVYVIFVIIGIFWILKDL